MTITETGTDAFTEYDDEQHQEEAPARDVDLDGWLSEAECAELLGITPGQLAWRRARRGLEVIATTYQGQHVYGEGWAHRHLAKRAKAAQSYAERQERKASK